MKQYFPLSKSEEGLFISSMNGGDAYNLAHTLNLGKKVTFEEIKKALEKVLNAHKYVFTILSTNEDGKIVKHIEEENVELQLEEVKDLRIESKPYEMLDHHLYRFKVYKVNDELVFYFDFHHILMDGTSIKIFIDDFFKALEGEEIEVEKETANDFSLMEEKSLNSEKYKDDKAYFEKLVGDLEVDSSLVEDKKEEEISYKNIRRKISIKNSEIKPFVKKLNIKTSTYFLTTFAYLLSKINMEEEALILTVNNARNGKYNNSFGSYVKTYPLYLKYENNDKVCDLLTRINEENIESVKHNLYPFSDLNKDFGISSDVLFAYQGDYFYKGQLFSTEIHINPLLRKDGKEKLSVELHRDDDNFIIWVEYRSDLYNEDTIMHLIKLYEIILHEFLNKESIKDINLVNDEELKLLDSFNENDLSFIGDNSSVLDEFKAIVKKYPNNKAVVFKDKSYTYQEVDKITNAIANKLIELGVTKEKVVSILIKKSEFIVLASLAVLKSGAAYQPLDPTYPKDRLNFMVNDSNAIILIRDDQLDDLIDDFKGEVLLTSQLLDFNDYKEINIKHERNDLFIMLYTSGSTGLPKGVMLEHGNILAFSKWYVKFFNLNSETRVSAYASYGFDADMMDLYPTLISGGCVYVIPDEMRLNLVELGQYFEENKIDQSFITTQVGRQFISEIAPKYLKNFIVGGEKLVPMVAPEGINFYNAYGPTEGTVFCTIHEVDRLYNRIPIGKALCDYKAYVLDKNKNRLPTLVNGELYISGPQVARGYLNREKENKEAFLTNNFTDEKEFTRLYKTGDIVRFLSDGTIDFIGRKDGQVKIRGFRIELSEVEGVIREFEGIKDVTVKDFLDPSGVKFIVAYVVSDEPVNVEELNKFIGSKKPPYMIPAYTMQLDKIPLNQNQKVNKRALPLPELKVEERVEPTTDDEKIIFDMLKDILGHEEFGVTNDFFEIGLTSVSSIRFTILLSKKFNKNVDVKDLKAYPNIKELTKFLSNKEDEEELELLKAYPISKTQEGIFVESISIPDSTTYNIPYLFKLSKEIDVNKLKECLIKVLDNHPYLKTILFMDDNGEILARRENCESIVTIINQELDKNKLIRPYKMLDSSLYRIEIYVGKDNYLFLDFHHIICDGTSMAIILNDLNKAYKGEELEKEIYTGFEVAQKERLDLKTDKLDNAKTYYNNVLKDVDGDYILKKDLKVNEKSRLQSIDYKLVLDNNLVKKFVDKNKLTNNALFNFAFAFTFSKFIYKKDALYVTIYNGRNSSKLMNTTSMLVKTLPVFIKYEEEDDILNKLTETKDLLSGLEENDLYAFSEIAKDYDISSDVMFAYQGDDFTFNEIGGHKVESEILESDNAKSLFGLDVFLENGVFRAHYEFDESNYNEFTIASFNRLFELVLNELLIKNKISEINLLSDYDKKLYEQFNSSDAPILEGTVNKLIEKQAKEKPNKVAVIAQNGKYTYDEFNKACNKVAHYLKDEFDIKIGETCVMLMPRIKEAYVVREGIIKSGGAFVPIDPKYPDDRIEYIITDSKTKYLISTKDIIKEKDNIIKNTGIRAIDIETILDSDKDDNLDLDIPQSSLAYVIYTSGSTGKPKGVMLAHHNLMNYVSDGSNLATLQYRDIGEDCVGCSFASLSFDASLQEELVPLTHGYTAVIASEEEIENPLLLAKTIKENKVNVMFMTPSYVSNLLDIDQFVDALRGFHTLDMGAEAVPIELCDKLRALGVNAKIHNGYGPTETTITCSYSEVSDRYMTIGKPVANTKFYLLDKAGHILPINAIGDLTIAGDSVGIGYLGLKEKTDQVFIHVNNLRAYRSGDLARYNNDGNIEFFGRLDNQVKLRGLRVELDEIEKVLNSYPSVTRSIILVKSSNVEGDYLAAYFTATNKVDINDLTKHMAKSLTPYMIPKAIMQLDKLPLTPNGKIDKKSLPEIVVEKANKEIKEASNELQTKILNIFKKALGQENIGIDDDFFMLGGTSLSASKVAMLALNENLNISYGDVFDNPTVLKLEEYINSLSKTEEKKESIKLQLGDLESLKDNIVEEVDDIELDFDVNSVLLTGCTGFLGIHLFKEILDQQKNIIALVRGGDLGPRDRLLGLLAYYFDSPLIEQVDKYVKFVDADVTDKNLKEKLNDYNFDLIINAAAIVKHFSKDDIIERVNVGGVKNLIEVAKEKKCRIVQISTLSVAGENIDNKFPASFRMKENMLEFGQDVSNKYVHSKFNAEKAILEAINEGLDAKVIRVGNLMGRQSDGEFQANSITNGFMRDLKGYATLHKFPVNSMDITIDFSPIDEVAKTILLLSRTNSKFTVYHAANSHTVEMGDIVHVLNELGFGIKVVSDNEFIESMKEMMMDEEKSMLVSSLISYSSSDMKTHSFIPSNNEFTNKALYHLDYKWPLTDYKYLRNAIEALVSLGFFERTDL